MSNQLIPKGVVLHFTASTFGDRKQIDAWHRANGWSGIGYHKVVLNGVINSGDAYNAAVDGKVEAGRAENIQGAHCLANSMNSCTLGISSVGMTNSVPPKAPPAPASKTTSPYLTLKQHQSLVSAVAQWCVAYNLNPAGTFVHPVTGKTHQVISQHSEHDSGKPSCASLQIANIRSDVVAAVAKLRQSGQMKSLSTPLLHADPANVVLPEFNSETPEGPAELESDVPTTPALGLTQDSEEVITA
jgi:hypothetical protein